MRRHIWRILTLLLSGCGMPALVAAQSVRITDTTRVDTIFTARATITLPPKCREFQGSFIFRGRIRDSLGVLRDYRQNTKTFKAAACPASVAPPVTVDSLQLVPLTAERHPGGTVQYGVTAFKSDGSSTSVAPTYTALGGAITANGLYTAGGVLDTFPVVASYQGKVDTAWVVIVAAPPLSVLSRVEIDPQTVSLHTGGSWPFTGRATWTTGTATDSVVSSGFTFTATGGTLAPSGANTQLYTAGASVGTFRVVATYRGRSDSAVVTVTAPPAPGPGTPFLVRDWSDFADESALQAAGIGFGVEGSLHNQPPARPTTDFWDLIQAMVPDGRGGMRAGRAIRYLGDPALNTTSTATPGRIAIHTAHFPSALENVWVRQFVRFTPNWTTAGANPSGGTSYKMMFFRFDGAGFRLGHLINGSRDEIMELGQGASGARLGAVEAKLPWDNHIPVSLVDGIGGMDAWPMLKVGAVTGKPARDGNGEWFEVVMHFEKVAPMAMQGTLAKRQYTVSGAVSPGAWEVIARQVTHTGDPAVEFVRPVVLYQMGVNRNKQWDTAMSIDWGRYELYDGRLQRNPLNVPWR